MKYKKIIFVSILFLLISLMCIFVLAQGVGYIQIKCKPGATVFLDNNFVGNTSSEIGGLILHDVPAGSHELKIIKEGYIPQGKKIDLKANEIYFYDADAGSYIDLTIVEGVGKWMVIKKIKPIGDPIDDTTTIILELESDSGKSVDGEPIILSLRYERIHRSETTNVIIVWNDYLKKFPEVMFKFGNQEAIHNHSSLSTNNEATFYHEDYPGYGGRIDGAPSDSIDFIRELMKVDRLVTQITPYNEIPIMAEFDVRGLKETIEPYNDILRDWLKDIQKIPVPNFDSYKWEVGIPGFAKPGEITKFKDTTIGKVQLSSPSNGAILPLGDITFSWNSVSNATKYQFILYNSRGQIALDTTKNRTSLTVALGIEETITWKVRAGENSGNWGAWSNVWSLTLKLDDYATYEKKLREGNILQGSLHCPNKAGYTCPSCIAAQGYDNHFKGFNVLTTQEDCYVKLVSQNGVYIGNKDDCEVTIKGEKWLGLEEESGTELVEEINSGRFNFKPANKFVERTMSFPGDNYQYEFANEGKEFRLYLSRNREEAFKAVPWQNIIIEIKNKETNNVFKYKFEKGIFPLVYSWNSGGMANYGQCIWWAAKRWVEEVDSKTLFPFYPPSPQAVNVKTIDSNYQPQKYDILINYKPGGPPEHYAFVEKVEGDQVYITQFNFIPPGEVYNYVLRTWNRNATNLFYSNNPSGEYYFKYYYRK